MSDLTEARIHGTPIEAIDGRTEQYKARQVSKAQRQAYRDRARAVFPMVTVPKDANVSRCEEGAFIECVVFLTDDPEEDEPKLVPASETPEWVSISITEYDAFHARLKQAEETRDAAQAEATKQTSIAREMQAQLSALERIHQHCD